jgi:hypothetical protein
MLCHAVIEAGWCCAILLLRHNGAVPCCHRGRVMLCHAVIKEGWCCVMLLLKKGGALPCYD